MVPSQVVVVYFNGEAVYNLLGDSERKQSLTAYLTALVSIKRFLRYAVGL